MVLGLDLGFRQTKLYFNLSNYIFPSVIGNPSIFEIDEFYEDKSTLDDLVVEYENELYYVGIRAYDTSNARLCIDTEKTESINEKVIYRAALGILLEKSDILSNISVVTGLPVEDFKQPGLKESLQNNMRGSHEFIFRGKTRKIDVDSVVVMPQAAGAYYDYILDDNGNLKADSNELAQGTVTVIDVGYKTTDVVTMVNGSYDSKRSFTMVKGMIDIHKELAHLIRYTYNRKFGLTDMDKLCKSGIMVDRGHPIDIRSLISKATKPIAEAILTEINATIGDTRGSDKVLGVGGTIALLNVFFNEYYRTTYETSDHPDSANAVGYGKYWKMVNA